MNLPRGDYMKKFSLIILSIIIFLVLSSCSSNITNDETVEINFSTKSVVYENDGWLYYCYVDFDKDSSLQNSRTKSYAFDAYNLKYKTLEDYNKIPVINENTNEIEGYFESSVPAISYNSQYSNDIQVLNDWLNTNQPTNNIEIKDLNDLNLQNIDIELFVAMFNEMINSESLKTGKFGYLPEADISQETLFEDGYKWQVGFFISHGILTSIDIELIYEDSEKEIHLSDIIALGNCSTEQKQIQDAIDALETGIMNNQDFLSETLDYSIGNVDFSRLKTLFESLIGV